MVNVLIADDQRLVRQGLQALLARWPEIQVVGEARDGQEAIDLARALTPDIVLMDVRMPRLNGIAATEKIRALGLDTRVLMVAMQYDPETVRRAIASGAKGFVAKCEMCQELMPALDALGKGRSYYSASVAQLLAVVGGAADDEKETMLASSPGESG